ncbi:hypothetical protein D9M71_620270 [compost metagenome]
MLGGEQPAAVLQAIQPTVGRSLVLLGEQVAQFVEARLLHAPEEGLLAQLADFGRGQGGVDLPDGGVAGLCQWNLDEAPRGKRECLEQGRSQQAATNRGECVDGFAHGILGRLSSIVAGNKFRCRELADVAEYPTAVMERLRRAEQTQ